MCGRHGRVAVVPGADCVPTAAFGGRRSRSGLAVVGRKRVRNATTRLESRASAGNRERARVDLGVGKGGMRGSDDAEFVLCSCERTS